ncbi:MAG: DinB family protein [Armatimonadetes bacterium]|nr:DinB family protein [Armatimonadota bacterium]
MRGGLGSGADDGLGEGDGSAALLQNLIHVTKEQEFGKLDDGESCSLTVMELQAALKGQYKAGLAMLRQCVEDCPDDLWALAPSGHPRTFWRIAYHALFYTHLYLMPMKSDFVPWEKHQSQATCLWDDDEEGIPPEETTYSKSEVLSYLDWIVKQVDAWVDALDLASPKSGFSWYRIPKLDHQLVNLRHLGTHTGQLQELLFARGMDSNWIGRR